MGHKLIIAALLAAVCLPAAGQGGFTKTTREGDGEIPSEAVRKGYSVQKVILAQMDGDPQLEQVILFGHDKGHWPECDLFMAYYAIVGNHDKKVKYLSDEVVTENYNMKVEDRNLDGISELYYTYIKEGSFKTDPDGWHMECSHLTDVIEFIPDSKTKKK